MKPVTLYGAFINNGDGPGTNEMSSNNWIIDNIEILLNNQSYMLRLYANTPEPFFNEPLQEPKYSPLESFQNGSATLSISPYDQHNFTDLPDFKSHEVTSQVLEWLKWNSDIIWTYDT